MLGNKNAQMDAEMDNFMFRIRKIDKQMPSLEENGAVGRSRNDTKGDQFLQLKTTFVERLFKLKKSIRDLQENSQGSKTAERIQKQSAIRQELKDLNTLINELEATLNKQINRRRNKLSEEERKARSALVRQLKSELSQIKNLSLQGYVGSKIDDIGSQHATDYGIQLEQVLSRQQGPGQPSNASGGRMSYGGGGANSANQDTGLSQEQVQRLQHIEERDQEHDQILDQIGDVVVDLKDLAHEIGNETEKQVVMLNGLEDRVDTVAEKLDSINLSMKKQLESRGMGGERFCVNMICCVILLGIVGVIVNTFT